MAAPGQDIVRDALDAGFTPDEVAEWQHGAAASAREAGFSEDEVRAYFGVAQRDLPSVRNRMAESYAELSSEEGRTEDVTFLEALENGFDLSITGMLVNGKIPTVPEMDRLSTFDRLTTKAAAFGGDYPFMVAGAIAGLGAGLSTGPAAPGAVPVGVGAGTFGVPALIRQALMDEYERQEGTSFRSFWEDFQRSAVEGAKGTGLGAAVGAVGPAVGAVTTMPGAVLASEIGTMTTLGAALEGRVPEPEEFLDNAILIGGFRAASHQSKQIAGKLRDVYRKTGIRPRDVVQDALQDPSIAEDMMSANVRTPRAYGGDEIPQVPRALQESITRRALEPELPEPTTAMGRVLANISVGKKDPKPRKTLHDYYTDWVDHLHPLNRAVKAMEESVQAEDPSFHLEAVDNAYRKARLHVGVTGKASHFLEYAPFLMRDLQPVGRSLKAILEPVKDDLQPLRAYLWSKRTIELEPQGKRTGISLEDARTVVRENPHLEPIAQELFQYQEHVLAYLRDSGIISENDFTFLRTTGENYIPMFRVMENPRADGLGSKPFARSPIRKMFGSDLRGIDPLESIIKNTYTFISLAERNAIGEAYVALAERAPNGNQYAIKVKPRVRPVTLSSREMSRLMEKLGRDERLTTAEQEVLDQNPIFRPAALHPEKGLAVVFRDGKATTWKIDEKVWEAFQSGDASSASMLRKFLEVPARTLRAGAIFTPEFIGRNPIRDQLSAYLFSGAVHPFQTFTNTARGVFHVLGKDELYHEWLRSGGSLATLVSLDRNYLQGQIRSILGREGMNLFESGRNVVKAPIEMLRMLSELAENATRLGEFERVRGEGPASRARLEEAAFASREVTLDFGRIGARAKSVNQIIAFFNASLQGTDKAVRSFRDKPLEMSAKVGASIVLPSMTLYALNRDEPGWSEIPQWVKDLFWLVPVDTTKIDPEKLPDIVTQHAGGQVWLRIPKPFEIGVIFGTGTERMMEWMLERDPTAFDDFTQTILRGATPSYMPTTLIPVLETFANRSLFLDRPLIPSNRERMLPEYQYRPYTTELTRAIGAAIADLPGMRMSRLASPAVIDNAIRGWTGGLGNHLVNLADKALREAGVLPPRNDPAWTLADTPFLKAFVVRYPTAGAESVQTFFDLYFENQAVIESIRVLQREGEFDEAAKLIAETYGAGQPPVDLSSFREALGQINKVIRLTYVNPELHPDEKRQAIESLYFQMIDIAKAGNQVFDTFQEKRQ